MDVERYFGDPMDRIEKEVAGAWALAKDAENTAVYESGDEACWYCGGSLEGLNLVHHIGNRTWHLRCVSREIERRRGLDGRS